MERLRTTGGRERRRDEVLVEGSLREVGAALRRVGGGEGADAECGVRDQARLHLLELVDPLLPSRRHDVVRALRSRAAKNLCVVLLQHFFGLVLACLAHGDLVVVAGGFAVGGLQGG